MAEHLRLPVVGPQDEQVSNDGWRSMTGTPLLHFS